MLSTRGSEMTKRRDAGDARPTRPPVTARAMIPAVSAQGYRLYILSRQDKFALEVIQ